jgi:hypothetical protein
MRWSVKCRIANMGNAHTSTVGCMDLFSTSVLLPHCEFIQLTGDVVSGRGIGVLGHVNIVALLSIVHRFLLTSEVAIEALPAASDRVIGLLVQLTYGFGSREGPSFTTTTIADSRMSPDLSRGTSKSISGDLNVDDEGSKQCRFESVQSLHHGSVGYQPVST